MEPLPDRIAALVTVEADGEDRFVAATPSDGPGRLFGGQVASQTLRAAMRTVDPDRAVHSLHAYFVRPGRPGEPLVLEVERTRDGRSFATRRVTACQTAGPIFTLTASFHVDEDGDDWALPVPTGVAAPEDITPGTSFVGRMWAGSPFEVLPAGEGARQSPPGLHPLWVRTRDRLPDDPGMHTAMLTFFSDMGVVGSARAPTSTLPQRFMGASLDHAMWFHRAARADEWVLFSVEPLSNAGARGLARGTMHTRDGRLVATVMQEALLRSTRRVPVP